MASRYGRSISASRTTLSPDCCNLSLTVSRSPPTPKQSIVRSPDDDVGLFCLRSSQRRSAAWCRLVRSSGSKCACRSIQLRRRVRSSIRWPAAAVDLPVVFRVQLLTAHDARRCRARRRPRQGTMPAAFRSVVALHSRPMAGVHCCLRHHTRTMVLIGPSPYGYVERPVCWTRTFNVCSSDRRLALARERDNKKKCNITNAINSGPSPQPDAFLP